MSLVEPVETSPCRAYDEYVTSNPPTQEPEEQRWQQPAFQPEPEFTQAPMTGPVVVPRASVPPPSGFESVVGSLAGLVWPVMILLAVFTRFPFWTAIIIALIASTVLGALKKNLKQRRHSTGSDQGFR